MDENKILISELKRLLVHYETNKDRFRSQALRKALKGIETYDKKIVNGEEAKKNIAGIGKGILTRIDEILQTGKLKELEGIVSEDEAINTITSISGIGPVKAKKLVNNGIKTIESLRKAIEKDNELLTHHSLIGLKWYEDIQQKIPREEIEEFEQMLTKEIEKIDVNLKFVICGSYRRGCATCSDIDVLITIKNADKNVEYLKKLTERLKQCDILVDDLTNNGDKKYMGIAKIKEFGRRIDIRFMEYDNFFAGMVYFTGSKNFNIKIRKRALELGYSLNEYSFKKLIDGEKVIIHSEEELFKILEMEYVTPSERNI